MTLHEVYFASCIFVATRSTERLDFEKKVASTSAACVRPYLASARGTQVVNPMRDAREVKWFKVSKSSFLDFDLRNREQDEPSRNYRISGRVVLAD